MNRDEMALRILLAFINNPPNDTNDFPTLIKISVESADALISVLKATEE
jgi:hypothetical protein